MDIAPMPFPYALGFLFRSQNTMEQGKLRMSACIQNNVEYLKLMQGT